MTRPARLIIVGFTGTRAGMTAAQKEEFTTAIRRMQRAGYFIILIHGDCIGADTDAHKIAVSLDCEIEIAPPNKAKYRAFNKGAFDVHPEKDYISRNHDIVNASTVVIATPSSTSEVLRSGTWATVRYARKTGKPIIIIYPDGTKISGYQVEH